MQGPKDGTITERARQLRRNMTNQERTLWRVLRNRALVGLKFRRQEPLGGYIADFCCIEKKLILELDGSVHEKKDQKLYDRERDRILREGGFRVVRILNDEIENNCLKVIERIRSIVGVSQ